MLSSDEMPVKIKIKVSKKRKIPVFLDNPSYWTDFKDLGTKIILGLQGLRLGWCPNPENPHRVTPTVSVVWPEMVYLS